MSYGSCGDFFAEGCLFEAPALLIGVLVSKHATITLVPLSTSLTPLYCICLSLLLVLQPSSLCSRHSHLALHSQSGGPTPSVSE